MDLSDPPAVEVLERRYDGGRLELLQRVTEASYFGRRERTWWQWLTRSAAPGRLVPPFDAEGRDVHALTAEALPMLDGDDDPLGSVRLARGIVTPLTPRERGDDVVLRDAWLDGSQRITSAIHFGLALPGIPPVAVAFAMSPLVIGRPSAMPLKNALEGVADDARERWLDAVGGLAGGRRAALAMMERVSDVIEVRVGDELEVRGVVTTPEQCRGRFDLEGRATSYRDAPVDLGLVVGDRQGLRMVIRKV